MQSNADIDTQHQEYVPQTLDFNGTAKFANELMFSRHRMSENELKVWLLTMASLSRNMLLEPDSMYKYDLRDIASKLGLNKRRPWKVELRDLFDGISSKNITIMKRYSEDLDQTHWLKMPLYTEVDYNEFNNSVAVSINQKLVPYLQNFTEKFTELEINEMLAIKGISALKVYMCVKELISEGINTIPIEEFKARLGMKDTYPRFKDFQRDVLKKSQEQIRKHTTMKEFTFTHNGRGRVPATTLSFSLSDTHQKKIPTPATKDTTTFLEKIAMLTSRQKTYFQYFVAAGIRPEETAYKMIVGYDMEVIESNYEYYQERKMKSSNIGPAYLRKSVEQDYAKKDREKYKARARKDETNNLRDEQYATETTLESLQETAKSQATAFIKNASMDRLQDLMDRATSSLYNMGEKMGFNYDIDRAKLLLQKRDLRPKEMGIFRTLLATWIMQDIVDPNEL